MDIDLDKIEGNAINGIGPLPEDAIQIIKELRLRRRIKGNYSNTMSGGVRCNGCKGNGWLISEIDHKGNNCPVIELEDMGL